MYEKITNYINAVKSQITIKRLVIGITCVLVICFVCSLASGYFETRANYQRTFEQLERTQRELDRSRQLNQSLKAIIERGSILNGQASERIERIAEYQHATSERITESLDATERASNLIGRSLELIGRIEERNQTE